MQCARGHLLAGAGLSSDKNSGFACACEANDFERVVKGAACPQQGLTPGLFIARNRGEPGMLPFQSRFDGLDRLIRKSYFMRSHTHQADSIGDREYIADYYHWSNLPHFGDELIGTDVRLDYDCVRGRVWV